MRIIHFSDLHVGGRTRELGGLFDKRLFGTLNHLARRARYQHWARVETALHQMRLLSPDVVICTGDLTSLSEPHEFRFALDLLRPLREDRRFRFLYVPGNHDFYVQEPHVQHALEEAFYELNRGELRLGELPRIVEHLRVRFLLVNEVGPAPFYASWGALSQETRARLPALLAPPPPGDDEHGIPAGPLALVGHFPLRDRRGRQLSWRRRCHGSEPLYQALTNGTIRLALCGHIHSPFARHETSGALECCAGSLPQNAVFNLIDWNLATGVIEQRWVPVEDAGPAAPIPALVGLAPPTQA